MRMLVWMVMPMAVGPWEPRESGTTTRLRGLLVVGAQVARASGADGTVIRTVAEGLDFRAIRASDARRAVALSGGSPDSGSVPPCVGDSRSVILSGIRSQGREMPQPAAVTKG